MDIENKIVDWLNKNGYPLEMNVAKTFSQEGFHVDQSDYFYDEETSNYRELDIIASIERETDNVCYEVRFLIECKYSAEHPWVVFKNKKNEGDSYTLMVMPGDELGRKMAFYYSWHKEIRKLPVLCNHKSIGYAAVETLKNTDKKDNCYSALMSLSKALYFHSEKPKFTHRAGRKMSQIFVPIVVIKGKLFEAYLNEKDEVEIRNVTRSSVSWNNPICGNQSSLIHIVTQDSLVKFCKIAKSSATKLLDIVIADGKIDKLAVANAKKSQKK
jgi:hypothetical protein